MISWIQELDELVLKGWASRYRPTRWLTVRYAKSCFLEKLENMDLTMLTCLNTPSRFVLKELEELLVDGG